MRKITGYKILIKFSPTKMEEEVRIALDAGWEPLGAPCVATFTENAFPENVIMQAVVKYEIYHS